MTNNSNNNNQKDEEPENKQKMRESKSVGGSNNSIPPGIDRPKRPGESRRRAARDDKKSLNSSLPPKNYNDIDHGNVEEPTPNNNDRNTNNNTAQVTPGAQRMPGMDQPALQLQQQLQQQQRPSIDSTVLVTAQVVQDNNDMQEQLESLQEQLNQVKQLAVQPAPVQNAAVDRGEVVEAVPLSERSRGDDRRRRRRRKTIIIAVAAFLMGIGLVVGLVAALSGGASHNPDSTTKNITSTPTSNPTNPPNNVPVVPPVTSPVNNNVPFPTKAPAVTPINQPSPAPINKGVTTIPTAIPTAMPTPHPSLRPTIKPTVDTTSEVVPTTMPSISNAPTTFDSFIIQQLLAIDPTLDIDVLTSEESTPQSRAIDWIITNRSPQTTPKLEILQLFVILTFYYSSTNFTQWFLWYRYLLQTSSSSICDWNDGGNIGIFCTGDSGFVTEIKFWDDEDRDVQGTLPTELGLLPQLEVLNLANQQIEGTLPTELGMLSNLNEMNLSRNQFFGPIPSELGNLSNLRSLNLRLIDGLTGFIPIELGTLQSLKSLSLSDNPGLLGPLPSGFESLTSLRIQGTFIEGEINCDTSSPFSAWANCQDGGQIICSSCCNYCCDVNGQNCGFVF